MYEDDSTPDAARLSRHSARVRPDDERGTVYTDDAEQAAVLYDEFYAAVVGRCERLRDGCLHLVGFLGDSTTALAAVAGELDDRHESALAGVLRAEHEQLQRVAAVLADYSTGAGELVALFQTVTRPDFVQVTP